MSELEGPDSFLKNKTALSISVGKSRFLKVEINVLNIIFLKLFLTPSAGLL